MMYIVDEGLLYTIDPRVLLLFACGHHIVLICIVALDFEECIASVSMRTIYTVAFSSTRHICVCADTR